MTMTASASTVGEICGSFSGRIKTIRASLFEDFPAFVEITSSSLSHQPQTHPLCSAGNMQVFFAYSWADENLQILSSNTVILVEISTGITEFSPRNL